jgi:hypothetical protein
MPATQPLQEINETNNENSTSLSKGQRDQLPLGKAPGESEFGPHVKTRTGKTAGKARRMGCECPGCAYPEPGFKVGFAVPMKSSVASSTGEEGREHKEKGDCEGEKGSSLEGRSPKG